LCGFSGTVGFHFSIIAMQYPTFDISLRLTDEVNGT
jgi:hypothetical protein